MAKTATWRDTPFAEPFYHSPAWRGTRQKDGSWKGGVRNVVWDRAHGLCERCKERGEMKPADVVHHKVPLTAENVNDPDIALNPERLVALCDECHTEVHREMGVGVFNGVREEEPRVGFDENGNVVRLNG